MRHALTWTTFCRTATPSSRSAEAQDLLQEISSLALSSGPRGLARGLQGAQAFASVGQSYLQSLVSGRIEPPQVCSLLQAPSNSHKCQWQSAATQQWPTRTSTRAAGSTGICQGGPVVPAEPRIWPTRATAGAYKLRTSERPAAVKQA